MAFTRELGKLCFNISRTDQGKENKGRAEGLVRPRGVP